MKNIAEKAAELLAGLGDTPDEIAEMLRGAGYRGVVGDAWECPCGACLRDHLGLPIRVEEDYVSDESYGGDPHVTHQTATVAKHVKAFVLAFDSRAYEDLTVEEEG